MQLCVQCQPWILRWSKELEAFVVINAYIDDEKSLFHIYERLSAEYPDVLRMHYAFIEQQYIEYKSECEKVVMPPKKICL